jgi:hypothetical protein
MYFLHLFSTLSPVIPFAAGVYKYPRLDRTYRLLPWLFAVAIAVDTYSFYCGTRHLNVLWLINIYIPIEYTFFILVFSPWQDNARLRTYLKWSIIGFVAIWIISLVLTGGMTKMNSFALSLACMIYALVSVSTLIILRKNDRGEMIYNPRFWISSGLLLYSSGSLAYFGFFPLIAQNNLIIVWGTFSVVNTLAYILFAIGFLCKCPQ